MQKPEIQIQKLSLQFMIYRDKSLSLKEAVINRFRLRHRVQVEKFWALKDLDLTIKENERVGIIGLNGAGKSSLLKTMCKIYTPSEGTIRISGSVAPLIEIGAGFHAEMSGRENIFLNGAALGYAQAEIEQKVEKIIAFSELGQFIDMPVKYYSTGMYMRLAFVIATEVNPDILLVDEMFAGGDASFVQKATKRLYNLFSEAKILIIVSHNMEYIRQLCNRVILLNKGRIIMDASADVVINYYLENIDTIKGA
jgi:ABC-type polysaccharide/polyol phosphate transport system ATPase subunit